MRFLANMGISPLTVEYLRERGHDALHLHDEGLDRLPDPEILEKASREGRILLTSDLGFGDLLAHRGSVFPSAILFRLADMRPESVNAHLEQVLPQCQEDLERGAIVSVTEQRIRVRALPIR